MALKFKTDRIEKEFKELEAEKNKALAALVNMLSTFVSLELNKDVVLTEIYRTKEEFDMLYSHTPAERRPKTSPHLFWRAVDIRSKIYTDAEIKRILSFLNTFRYVEGRPVGIYHAIAGNVSHFHIQYVGHDAT
jgi:hypothetical protein